MTRTHRPSFLASATITTSALIRSALAAALFAAVLLAPTPTRAQDPGAAARLAPDPVARRAQVVASSPLGAPFRASNRQEFQVVAGLRAVPRGAETPAARMSALAIPSTSLLEVKGSYLIIEKAPVAATAALRIAEASAISAANEYPVVVNPVSGQLGVLQGILVVKLHDPQDAAAIANANGLALEYVAANIRYAYFRVPPGRDVIAAAAALQKDARVESAAPEVSQGAPVPN